ncbi:MAG: transcriptional repressor LexA [Candidatus Eremiobacteraeota bacterium]|nr:transcriptional repressor LexA [Candidatus Eremiobacteraeota bacterium]
MDEKLKNLTKRQRSILNFIVKFTDKNGFPPTIRDIGKAVGLSSSSTIHFHLGNLEKVGLIQRDPTKPRAMKVLISPGNGKKSGKKESESPVIEKREDVVDYPLVIGYQEEIPFFSERNVEKIIPLPIELFGSREGFLLRMPGKGMIDIGINDGDLCIMKKTNSVDDGDIAVIATNREMTVKRVFRHLGVYRLEPENRRMNPVYVKELKVLGKLTGVLRLFS